MTANAAICRRYVEINEYPKGIRASGLFFRIASEARSKSHLGEVHSNRVVDPPADICGQTLILARRRFCRRILLGIGRFLAATSLSGDAPRRESGRLSLIDHVDARLVKAEHQKLQLVRIHRFIGNRIVQLLPGEIPLLGTMFDQEANRLLHRIRCDCRYYLLGIRRYCHLRHPKKSDGLIT